MQIQKTNNQSINLTNPNLNFGEGKLIVSQDNYDHIAKELERRLKGHVAKMPDGDIIETVIVPTGYCIRTKYKPGINAPKDAPKLTLASLKNDPVGETDTFIEELSTELQKPEFSIREFLEKTSVFICENINRMFVKSGKINNEVKYNQEKNVYELGRTSKVLK